MEKTTYRRMLEDRFYLYRPWIPISKSMEAEAIRGLELKPPVLDIGCGTGLFGKYCYKTQLDVGLDCDRNALKEASEKGVYKTLETADACDLPFSDNSFNTIVSVCAIEHIPALDRVLEGVHRTLKSGGKFIFTVPSAEFGEYLFASRLLVFLRLYRPAERYGEQKQERSGHIHIYEPSTWQRLLGNKGFRVESIDYIFPKEAVFLWSFMHSFFFRVVFLPFRLARDFKIKFIDDLLRGILDRLFSDWLAAKSKIYKTNGGYLLIQASKP